MTDRSPSPPASRRENYYNSQRASLSSAGTLSRHDSPRSRSRPKKPRREGRSHTEEYDVPDDFGDLTESAVPPPIQNPRDRNLYRHRSLEDGHLARNKEESARSTWPRPDHFETTGSPSRSRARTRTARRPSRPLIAADEYSFSEEYENLNEFAGPSPIENPADAHLYHHETLEEERHRSQQRRKSRRESQVVQVQRKRPSAAGIQAQAPEKPTSAAALPTTYQQPESSLEAQLQAAQSEAALAAQGPSERRQRVSRFATQLYTVSYLILFSMLGTLARLGLQWLTFYPGAPVVTSVLWANFAGSLVMGFLAEDRRIFREEWGGSNGNNNNNNNTTFASFEKTSAANKPTGVDGSSGSRSIDREEALRNHARVKKSIPLYIGLATGFCGSLTSFSSFMRDAFLALANNLPAPVDHPYPAALGGTSTSATVSRNGGYSLLALLAVLLLTISLSLSALKLGAHVAIVLDPLTPTVPYVLLRKLLDRAVVVVAWGGWLGAVVMSIWPPDRHGAAETWRGQALFACVFAPVGCLGRFYASLQLNGVAAAFPLGTFAVNVFGCAVEAMAFDLQHVPIGRGAGLAGGGPVACQLLQGVMDGFCGALTTVSTWVAELNGLRRAHGYVYGAASVAAGLAMMVAIMGSVRWGVGWSDPVCVT